jgi:hypothetical protein
LALNLPNAFINSLKVILSLGIHYLRVVSRVIYFTLFLEQKC